MHCFFSVNMDSKCPVIENVDDNSNKDEVTDNDTTLSSKEEENNSNELPSVNDNESTAQNQNNDQQEQTRNLVNKREAKLPTVPWSQSNQLF